MLLRLFLVALLIGLGGCAGSGVVSGDPPRSLAEVNHVLAGKEARVLLADGTAVTGESVAVFPDSVRFATGKSALPTSRVRRITYERDRISPGAGAAGGALVGLGFVTLAAFTEEESRLLFVVVGGVIVVGSAVLGLVIGMLEEVGAQERVAYEGPLTRYVPVGPEQR